MTETTTPDPQASRWRATKILECPNCGNTEDARWQGRHNAEMHQAISGHLAPVMRPLTVADIPGGQGAASLFVEQIGASIAVYYKVDSKTSRCVAAVHPEAGPAERAFVDYLAATLPALTEEA